MLKKIFSLNCFIFLFANIAFGQVVTPFPRLTDTDIPETEHTGTRIFTNESLYGYIDGGAELYLEYGFDSLLVTDLTFKNHDIKAEVYRMTDPAAAFGIFSVSRFKCSPGKELTEFFCRSTYQLQFCKGCFYVSIVNSNGTEAEQRIAETIASLLIDRIGGISFDPSFFFPEGVSKESMGSAVLVRGPMGIFNGASGISESLEEAYGYTALIIKSNPEPVISVLFDSEATMSAFLEKEKIDIDALRRGEEILTASGDTAMMICVQHLILKIH
jgi:hypothetical protein